MNIKKRIGQRIKELRQKNGMTQETLSEAVGIATKHQSYIETGKNFPSAKLLENYAKIFKIDEGELLNICYTKDRKDLFDDISNMINKANDSQIKIIHKFLSSILK